MGNDRKLVRFDDAIVNTTDRLERYEVNLVFYRREDIEPIKTDMDLGFLLHLQPQVYGIRRALNPMPIHDNFNKSVLGAVPKNVTNPKNKITVKSVDDQTDKENLVGTQCVQKKDTVSTLPNASANTMTITSAQLSNIISEALDLTLTSISNKDTDISMTAQLTEENDSQQELPTLSQNNSNDNDKEITGADSDVTEPYNIEEGLNLDSENFVYPSEFDSSVNYSDIDDSTQDPTGDKTTDEVSPSNYETENPEHDLHKRKSDVDEKSARKSSSGKTEPTDIDSDSESSNTASKVKPDWSLQPPLISNRANKNKYVTARPRPKPKKTEIRRNTKPKRTQPKREAKLVEHYTVASTSSSDEIPDDPKDSDFNPEDMNGKIY